MSSATTEAATATAAAAPQDLLSLSTTSIEALPITWSSASDHLTDALRNRQIMAKVIDVDHHRGRMGMNVNTDYIVQVADNKKRQQKLQKQQQQQEKEDEYYSGTVLQDEEGVYYLISKTYSQFRSLALKIRNCSDIATKSIGGGGSKSGVSSSKMDKPTRYLVQFASEFTKLIDSEPVEYLAKVSYTYVKKMSRERTLRLNDALKMLTNNFPSKEYAETNRGCRDLVKVILTFFWTDHVVEDDDEASNSSRSLDRKQQQKEKRRSDASSSSSTSSIPSGMIGSLSPKSLMRRKKEHEISEAEVTGMALAAQRNSKNDNNNNRNDNKKHTVKTIIPTTVKTTTQTFTTKTTTSRNETADTAAAVVRPITRKRRQSLVNREKNELALSALSEEGGLLLQEEEGTLGRSFSKDDYDDDGKKRGVEDENITKKVEGQHSTSQPTKKKSALRTMKASSSKQQQQQQQRSGERRIISLVRITFVSFALYGLHKASKLKWEIHGDYLILFAFVSFCLGRQMNKQQDLSSSPSDLSARNKTRGGRKIRKGVKSAVKTRVSGGDGAVEVIVIDKEKKKKGVTISPPATPSSSPEGKISDQHQASLHLLRKSMSQRALNTSAFLRKSLTGADTSYFVSSVESPCSMALSNSKVVEVEALPSYEEEEEEEEEEEDEDFEPRPLIMSPLRTFPKNGDPETDLNCTSEPTCEDFMVRGSKYFVDKKKYPSGPFLFPFRGADLLLTDECPENVGRNSAILGGKLRDVPTFLLNFRLPWGVFVIYFEIPSKFLPFVKYKYEPNSFNDSGDSSSRLASLPSLDDMTPAERCACRFLMGDNEHKKQTLKLLPTVVIGPWIVKSVVGSKPAIIGNKLPVNYIYEPADPSDDHKKHPYLEADLDIVASAAARKILSVVRSATQGLTIDLGFLCEGKKQDELPEQMLVGVRLHGLDPLNASLLPPMPHDEVMMNVLSSDDDDEDE